MLNILSAIERCAGEVVTDILEIAETYDPEDGQLQLAMNGKISHLSLLLIS